MRKGDYAEIEMKKILCAGGSVDKNVYECSFLKYNMQEECIYLVLQSGTLEQLSLDAIYQCEIRTEKERIDCTGRIKERYSNETGKIIKFQVENGFYKINLKSVDKQMA